MTLDNREQLTHIPSLDGLRGTAALMIMVFHFSFAGTGAVLQTLEKVKVFGQTGVDLFFVLSGFLITRILISAKNSQNFFSAFYIRRTLRIFPLYYAFLIFTYFIFFPFLIGTSTPPFKEQFWFWFYLQGIPMTFGGLTASGPGHFWSLAIEEHYYLIWPFLVYTFSEKRLFGISIGLIILSILIRFIFLQNHFEVFYFTFTRMDALAAGSILAILESKKGSLGSYRYLFLKLLGGIGIFLVVSWLFLTGKRLDIIQLIKFTVIALCYFCLIGYLVGKDGKGYLSVFFGSRFLRFCGKISYGLYVFHPAVFALVEMYLKANIFLNLIASFLGTFIIASLSFFFFETKILRYKDSFVYARGSKNTVTN